MKQYLIETFLFNDKANRAMMEKLNQLSDPSLCIQQLSHLINSQYKWMARIQQYPTASQMDWWQPVYSADELLNEWQKSLQPWIQLVEQTTEEALYNKTEFIGRDNTRWSARFIDIALQLNYHSIHHRAQMQVFIRQQGIEPDFIDYIGTKYKKRGTEISSL